MEIVTAYSFGSDEMRVKGCQSVLSKTRIGSLPFGYEMMELRFVGQIG